MSSTSIGETLTFGCMGSSITSFVSFLTELDGIQCWRFWVESWFPNGSLNLGSFRMPPLEDDSDLTSGSLFVTFFCPSYSTRLQHDPRTCPVLPSFWQANDSQLCTSWVSPEQESQPCHICPRPVGMVTGRTVSREIRDWVAVRRHRRI